MDGAADAAVAAVAEQMMADSLPYIPDDGEHALRDAGRIEKPVSGERALTWSNVYAAYQWFGVRADGTHVVRRYTTPGTGTAWVDRAGAANQDTWNQVAQNAFTGALE